MTMHMRSCLSGLLPGALCLFSAMASAAPPRFELTPFFGARLGGDFELVDEAGDVEQSVDLDSGTGYGLDLGLYRDSSSFYELLYSRQEANLDSSDTSVDGIDVTVEYLHFGGTLLIPQEEQWLLPYLSLTIGATRFEPKEGDYDSETKFSASLGGGLRVPFNERVAATLGVRGYLTFVDSDTDLFCVSGSGGGTCLLRSSGSTFFQGEATLGLTLRF